MERFAKRVEARLDAVWTMREAVRVIDQPQQFGGNVRVARQRPVRLEPVSDRGAIDARRDDLRVAAVRLPRPSDLAPISEYRCSVFPSDRLTAAHDNSVRREPVLLHAANSASMASPPAHA